MKYKTVPGVVLTSVCGSHFLVSSKNTMQVNETVVFYWKQLEHGASEEELIEAAKEQYEIDDMETLQQDIGHILHSLMEMHMLKRSKE